MIIRMATTDIVIHKGEREEKYQLYVEDYVMSYLKNYGMTESGTIFFYGKREQGDKKYYIYGAGRQKQISYFAEYGLLEEIMCHMEMDMPVFSIKEDSGIYDLAGYYIFYQSNEAMQSYMVEQRKVAQYKEKTKEQMTIGQKTKAQKLSPTRNPAKTQKKTTAGNKAAGKTKGGLMTVQLSAIFVILIAIVINSTNSYTKLEELNQAAVEVFFAMENKEASEGGAIDSDRQAKDAEDPDARTEGNSDLDIPTEGTVLRLEDLDTKFEEENRAVQQEEAGIEALTGADGAEEAGESGHVTDVAEETGEAVLEEISPSRQAFARNFAEYYQIEKGDTLNTISIKIYGDTSKVNAICELNQITDPDNIKYGQKILLP